MRFHYLQVSGSQKAVFFSHRIGLRFSANDDDNVGYLPRGVIRSDRCGIFVAKETDELVFAVED